MSETPHNNCELYPQIVGVAKTTGVDCDCNRSNPVYFAGNLTSLVARTAFASGRCAALQKFD